MPDIAIGAPRADFEGISEAGKIYFYCGASFQLLYQTGGNQVDDHAGSAVASFADYEVDGFPEVLSNRQVGASGFGEILAIGLDPFLVPSVNSLSTNSGGAVYFDIDFPSSAGADFYQILASLSGKGPTSLNGVEIPLTPDNLYFQTLALQYPIYGAGFFGVLSQHGDAGAWLAPGPGDLPANLVGTNIYLAAVSKDPLGGVKEVSAARILTVEP
ncbi:MAG: hypothetical protein DWQ01_10075 [Planctomycetota bacterium]|nr:MAG: hypothetical protein DWQ01_10075 [Planctomycetota bacterium]